MMNWKKTAAFLLTVAAAASTMAMPVSAVQFVGGDMDGDDDVNAADAALILQYAAYRGAGGTKSIYDYLAPREDTVQDTYVLEGMAGKTLAELEDAGFDIQLGEVVDTLENTSIPSAVRKTIKNQMVNAAVIAVQSKVDGTDYEDAVTNKVAKYMVLTALDGVAQREHDSDCFASDAASAKKSAVDSGEMAGLIDQIREEPQMVKAIEAAEPFQDLLTFDSLHDMYFEDLAEVLEVKAVAAAIDAQKEAGLMEDITAAFSAVPEGATVTIGGKKLSERQVKAMKEADTTKEARLAAIDALDTLGKLSMSSFADGLDVTMEAPGNSYTLNMTILAD